MTLSAAASQILGKALRACSSAYLAGRDLRLTVGINGRQAGAAYDALRKQESIDQVHAEFRDLERKGVLAIVWDHRAGRESTLREIRILDADGLAATLGEVPLWKHLAAAEEGLRDCSHSRIAGILADWKAGKSVRGRGPEQWRAFRDAATVLANIKEDVPQRRLSSTLFDDSKRIEDLAVELDALTNELGAPARDKRDVFSSLGLMSFSSEFFLAGEAVVTLTADEPRPCPRPYMAVAPRSILVAVPHGRWILSVENKTTFNELSEGRAGRPEGLLLYTAGFPSPSWLQAYRRILGGCPTGTRVFHWSDTDVSGLRICVMLDRIAREVGLAFEPFAMGQGARWKDFTVDELTYAVSLAEERGWTTLAQAMRDNGICIEQEKQALQLPVTM